MSGQDTTLPNSILPGADEGVERLAIRWVFPSTAGDLTVLRPGVTTLGRDPGCLAVLPSASVSRRHAEIRWTIGGAPLLLDLNSTNGVSLNGRATKQASLAAGDVLRFGDWVGIVVALIGAPEPWSFRELTAGYWGGPVLQAALGPAKLVARSDLPMIIQGETGSGKEGAARAIHAWSGRQGPFVALNCAALPETLAEAELFGYRKGAFTGADRASAGYLRAAHGGTLFLDEIAELPLGIQAKLLRAVEQRELVPLGESTPVPVDVRLLAATQGSLRAAVAERRFRGDLLARLDGLTVAIPTLRRRAEEIPALFRVMVEQHGARVAPRLDPILVERLCAHDWPFNVRELALLARKLLALHPGAAMLDHTALAERTGTDLGGADARPWRRQTAEMQAPDPETFLAALRERKGNVKQTAQQLGISRGRAYRMMDKLDALDLAALRRGDGDPSGA